MTDDAEPELTPEAEARLREVLGSARADGPMPDAVAQRMDGVLAGLAAEDGSEGVVGLQRAPSPRRRRVGLTLLAGAAALVLGGVAVGQLIPAADEGADTASSALDAESADEAPERGAAGADSNLDTQDSTRSTEESLPEESESDELGESAPAQSTPTAEVPTYTVRLSDSLRGVRAIERRTRNRGTGADGFVRLRIGPPLRAVRPRACSPTEWGEGRLVPVRFEGSQAVLALRPSEGDAVVADVLQCGTGEVVRSVTVPSRR